MENFQDSLKFSIANRFKSARKALGLTQRQLADLLKMDSSSIGGIEIGKVFPSIPITVYLMEKFNVSPTWLLTGKGNMFMDVLSLHSFYPDIPNDSTLDEMIKCLQVPLVYHQLISNFIVLKRDYKSLIDEYFDQKEEVNNGVSSK